MEWIDNIVVGLIDTYSTNDPYELCDLLGIIIKKVDREYILLGGNESSYFRNAFGNELIYLRDDLDRKHQEFYLLHEIGHAIIHTHVDCSNQLANIGRLEKQANYFAFKIANIIFDKYELQDLTIEQISKHLRIPLKPLRQFAGR